MSVIKTIAAREMLDSRGNPTIEAEVLTDDGYCGRAISPSGASTGKKEAIELRDGDDARFHGKGVLRAARHIEEQIADALRGMAVADQTAIDARMIALDGSENKANLGANAILAVSMATARAAAASQSKPLYEYLHESFQGDEAMRMPVPMINILNGGSHASGSTDVQEFMIVPVAVESLREAVRVGAEIFQTLKSILAKQNHVTTVGDEGGFAPQLNDNEQALSLLMQATEQAGYRAGEDVYFALDVASSEMYRDGRYALATENRSLNSDELIALYRAWCDKYPLLSIEDGLDEDDWDGWASMTEALGSEVQLVGDDLFVTNPKLIRQGIERKVANAVLIKLNQIGTVSETLEAMRLSRQAGYRCVVSHRSGETEDVFIADLAVATGAGQIKTGSLSRTDRVAKYNQLMRIESALEFKCPYAGKAAFGDAG